VLPWVREAYGIEVNPNTLQLACMRAWRVMLMSKDEIELQLNLSAAPADFMAAYRKAEARKGKKKRARSTLARVVYARTLREDDVPWNAIPYLAWRDGVIGKPSSKGDPVSALKKNVDRAPPFYVPLPR
jgi:hypothetical protein